MNRRVFLGTTLAALITRHPSFEVTTPLLYRGLDRHLRAAARRGYRYFVCSHLNREEYRTQQDWRELAALFNRSGRAARAAGLQFVYRIQADELPLMQAWTDPSLVRLDYGLWAWDRLLSG